MRTIRLATWIHAPVERCFRLSLSIDLQVGAAHEAGEQLVSGVRSGLVGLDDMVTCSARWLGMRYRHANLIDELRPYTYYREVMVEGSFRRFEHEHHFAPLNDGTRLRDELRFSCPGPAGELMEMLLRRRLADVVRMRNRSIRQAAESGAWQRYLAPRRPPVAHMPEKEKVLFRA